jgi:hypothetical protein
MKKNRSVIFSVSLIVIGSFLEIFYYSYRFTNDGISAWLSIIIGVALTLLLSLAVYQRKKRIMWLIIIPVSIYSILATSAGQSFSLGLYEKNIQEEEAKEEYRQDEISEIRERIKDIDMEIIKLNNQISGTITSLEDRYEWKYTLASTEERIDELKNERSILYEELNNTRITAVTHESQDKAIINIYEFYHSLFGWPKRAFQFILQTVLSAFIALMSPVGIITLGERKNRQINRIVNDKKIDYEPYIRAWVRANWMGKRNSRSNNILAPTVFAEYMRGKKAIWNTAIYNRISKTAREIGVINGNEILVEEPAAVKKLVDSLCKT